MQGLPRSPVLVRSLGRSSRQMLYVPCASVPHQMLDSIEAVGPQSCIGG